MEPDEMSVSGEPKTAKEPEYAGRSRCLCILVNLTGFDLNGVKVTHRAGSVTEGWGGDGFQLDAGQQVRFGLTHDEEGKWADYWDVWFKDIHGNSWSRSGKRCDVYESDVNSEFPVYVLLHVPKDGFSIQLPVTGSCVGNRY